MSPSKCKDTVVVGGGLEEVTIVNMETHVLHEHDDDGDNTRDMNDFHKLQA